MANETRDALEIMEDSRNVYERKNADYGDSWKLTGKTLALWAEHNDMDEIRVPVEEGALISFGLFTRRLDKMIREFNGWFMMDEDEEFQVDESITETHGDDVPYSAMHTQIAEESNAEEENNFEFIDSAVEVELSIDPETYESLLNGTDPDPNYGIGYNPDR